MEHHKWVMLISLLTFIGFVISECRYHRKKADARLCVAGTQMNTSEVELYGPRRSLLVLKSDTSCPQKKNCQRLDPDNPYCRPGSLINCPIKRALDRKAAT